MLLLRILMLYLEIFLISYFGWINKWGASVSKPIVVLCCISLLAACVYSTDPCVSWIKALGRSAEVASLAGYTRYNLDGLSPLIRFVEYIQLLVCLSVHSVLFATIVARISRVR